jgi:hypothetical protein
LRARFAIAQGRCASSGGWHGSPWRRGALAPAALADDDRDTEVDLELGLAVAAFRHPGE